ncbi:MAG: hypothetical protein FJY85_25030, partial [Deltaproteobacteria bacterium]|nr:hypothetical protein [Deltaproteobacteria bacterium]
MSDVRLRGYFMSSLWLLWIGSADTATEELRHAVETALEDVMISTAATGSAGLD